MKCEILVLSFNPVDSKRRVGGIERFLKLFLNYLESKSIGFSHRAISRVETNFLPSFPLFNLLRTLLLGLSILLMNRENRPNAIYAQDLGLSGLLGVITSKVLAIPVIMHCHNLPSLQFRDHKNNAIQRILYRLIFHIESYVISESDAIIVTNRSLQKSIQSRAYANIVVLPMAIDIKRFNNQYISKEIRKEFNIPLNAFVVGTVGRLVPVKNHEVLIRGFNDAFGGNLENKERLVIVGSGPCLKDLMRLCNDLDIRNKVLFTGFRNDVDKILQELDVFVLPSFSEGSPISLLEAMASSLPVIVSDIKANREIVSQGEEGLFFNPNDSEELARLLQLLSQEPNQRYRLSKNAAKTAENYDYKEIFPKILKSIMAMGK